MEIDESIARFVRVVAFQNVADGHLSQHVFHVRNIQSHDRSNRLLLFGEDHAAMPSPFAKTHNSVSNMFDNDGLPPGKFEGA